MKNRVTMTSTQTMAAMTMAAFDPKVCRYVPDNSPTANGSE